MKGFGFVKFHLDFGESVLLHDVIYVPGLKKNLVSISTLEDKGMRVAFIRGKVLTWPMESCMRDAFTLGSRIEGPYRVNGRPMQAMVHDIKHQSELRHRRLARQHYEALPKVRKFVSGMPDVQSSHDGVCSGCVSGKKTRGPFPSCKNTNNDILQLIHSDLCGPMPMHSLGGYLYYIIFNDDISRKTWIFYLKHKDEAFDMFKDFNASIESNREENQSF